MALIRKLWDSFTGVYLARRQNDQTVPGMCYDDCNNAALQAQDTGKNPSLCESESPFQTSLGFCRQCVVEFSSSDNFTSTVGEQLGQFLDYCADTNSDAQKIQELLSSKAAVESSLQELTGTGPASAVSTTLSTTATTDASGPITVTAVPTGTPGSSNAEIIAPSVIVPVAVVVAALGFLWRRRKLRRKVTRGDDADIDSDKKDAFMGKPELPADSVRPELEGTKPAEKSGESSGVIAELPAREVVGSELDARTP